MASGYIRVGINGRDHYLHRLVMAELIGRPLLPSEQVHHLDGNRANNSPANLRLLSSAEHQRWHFLKHPAFMVCAHCGRTFFNHWRTPPRPDRCCSISCAMFRRWARQRAARFKRQPPRPRAPHSAQRIGQHLGHVTRAHGRQVLDLMAATGPGGDHAGAEVLATDFLGERLGHLQR